MEHHHWEVYLASQYTHDKDGTTAGTAPHFEVNYGVVPDVQLHAILPFVYTLPNDSSHRYGLGDVELGVKYRFIHEGDAVPQVGIFPIVDLPSGNSSKGLGEGHAKVLIPLWLQKSWGQWTTYGGGGFWYNPGTDKKNYWFGGWELQREISKSLTLGAEIFGNTRPAVDEGNSYGFNLGAIINLSEEYHILISSGRDIHGPNNFTAYAAFQWTFGPHEEKKEK